MALSIILKSNKYTLIHSFFIQSFFYVLVVLLILLFNACDILFMLYIIENLIIIFKIHFLSAVPPTKPAFIGVRDIHDCIKCIPAQLFKPLEVQCYSEGGSQPVNIDIFKADKNITSQSTTAYISKGNTASYHFTPTMQDIDIVFKCVVKNAALPMPLEELAQVYIYGNKRPNNK